MKHLNENDRRFTELASDDSRRASRISELFINRKKALWSVLCVSAVAVIVLWRGNGVLWFGCAALACIFTWCQFFQVQSELRALQAVDALRRVADVNAA